MGKVKSALEIALEKADKIGTLSLEEKEKIREEEKVASIMKDYYQGKIDSNALWQQLKESKPALLKMVQLNLIDTISLGSSDEETEIRKKGILAVESLKENQRTPFIDSALHAIEDLRKEFEEMKERIAEDLKRQIEMHPQLRMQPVRSPDGRTVMQMSLSVDEAVKSKLADYLAEHEKQYNMEFAGIIQQLKEQIQ